MHEMSIAMNIIEMATEAAETESAHTINTIEVKIGSMSGVMVESLDFCFEAASKNTLAQGARLIIHRITAQGRCPVCDLEFEMDSFGVQCDKCGRFLDITCARDQLRISQLPLMHR